MIELPNFSSQWSKKLVYVLTELQASKFMIIIFKVKEYLFYNF